MTQDVFSFHGAAAGRRRWLQAGLTAGWVAWAAGPVRVLAAAPVGRPSAARPGAFVRGDSRARFKLAADFEAPLDIQTPVPFTKVDFQVGSDLSLLPDGKVAILNDGLYEIVFSCDWEATAEPLTDIDLRQIGVRRQRSTDPDTPTSAHERLGFSNVPGSDSPRMARYRGAWTPPRVAQGAVVSVDIHVSPPGIVSVGDLAQAAHTGIQDASLGPAAVAALMVHAKVVAADTVRVSLYNPNVAAGIEVPAGMLSVLAMDAVGSRGSSGDTWQVLHTASVALVAGDRVYGMIKHKVPGTLLQSTRSSFLQIDRLA